MTPASEHNVHIMRTDSQSIPYLSRKVSPEHMPSVDIRISKPNNRRIAPFVGNTSHGVPISPNSEGLLRLVSDCIRYSSSSSENSHDSDSPPPSLDDKQQLLLAKLTESLRSLPNNISGEAKFPQQPTPHHIEGWAATTPTLDYASQNISPSENQPVSYNIPTIQHQFTSTHAMKNPYDPYAISLWQQMKSAQEMLPAALGMGHNSATLDAKYKNRILHAMSHNNTRGFSQLRNNVNQTPYAQVHEQLVGIHGDYQPYCRQVITDDLNKTALHILSTLKELQNSDLFNIMQMNAMGGRRYFCSLKEVSKIVHKARLLIIAPNVRPSPLAQIKPVHVLQHVMACADAAGVPYVFALSRKGIGQVFGKDKNMSIVAVMRIDQIEREYALLLEQAKLGREIYSMHRLGFAANSTTNTLSTAPHHHRHNTSMAVYPCISAHHQVMGMPSTAPVYL